MSNLIEQHGIDFFNNKFAGSFFRDEDGKAGYVIRGSTDGDVYYYRVTGTAENCRQTERTLPHDFFEGFGTFAVPALGWRSSHSGKYLSFFSRNNTSYARGLKAANLIVQLSSMTQWLMHSGNLAFSPEEKHKCLLSLSPEFLPFAEGVARMREGNIISFAMSDCVAVLPAAEGKFDIYFRQNKAGEVMPDGSLNVNTPILRDYIGDAL